MPYTRYAYTKTCSFTEVRTATEYYPFGSMLEGWGCSQSFDCSLNTYSFTDTLLSDSYNTGLLSDLIKFPYYEYALLTGSSVSYYTEISGNRYLVFNSTTRNQPIIRRIYGVEDYKTYTARFKARLSSGSAEITIRKYLKSDSTVYSNATSKVVSLNGTWKTDSISFTVDPLYRYTVHVRNSASFGTTSINIDFIEVYGEASASYLTCSEDSVGYRFGFGGQEKENDISGLEGGHLSYQYRIHDARLGRFLSVDPMSPEYPYNSSYAFAQNCVISGGDLEGREHELMINHGNDTDFMKAAIKTEDNATIIASIYVIAAYSQVYNTSTGEREPLTYLYNPMNTNTFTLYDRDSKEVLFTFNYSKATPEEKSGWQKKLGDWLQKVVDKIGHGEGKNIKGNKLDEWLAKNLDHDIVKQLHEAFGGTEDGPVNTVTLDGTKRPGSPIKGSGSTGSRDGEMVPTTTFPDSLNKRYEYDNELKGHVWNTYDKKTGKKVGTYELADPDSKGPNHKTILQSQHDSKKK